MPIHQAERSLSEVRIDSILDAAEALNDIGDELGGLVATIDDALHTNQIQLRIAGCLIDFRTDGLTQPSEVSVVANRKQGAGWNQKAIERVIG